MFDTLSKTYEYLARGGPMMGVIGLFSVVCVALILERYLALRKEKIIPGKLVRELNALLMEHKTSEALALARASDAPFAEIVQAGLHGLHEAHEDRQEIKDSMESAGRKVASDLDRNLEMLGTLAATGPLLGLLGTVTGMIRTFGVIREIGVGDPMKLSGGISEALLCTAGGLLVGIPALIFQRHFLSKVDRYLREMESYADKMIKTARKAA